MINKELGLAWFAFSFFLFTGEITAGITAWLLVTIAMPPSLLQTLMLVVSSFATYFLAPRLFVWFKELTELAIQLLEPVTKTPVETP